ncbi:MAG: iron ABC transporter permease [Anaerolineae bacterium]
MQKTVPLDPPRAARSSLQENIIRRVNEFRLIAQDNVLMAGLLVTSLFVLLFVLLPLVQVIIQGFFNNAQAGAFSLEYFARYFDPAYRTHSWNVLRDTMVMGLASAGLGTLLGFVFAYTVVRCNIPFPRLFHIVTLLPTISPPFAIAIAAILLFGRNGLITRQILGIDFAVGVNDIYGLDGLVFVQVVTFFSVAYLIIRAMLERLNPALEEAALSMGASKFHIFRTVTLPLLIPGLAGSFLLLFVESLADLGNPLLIAGNSTVLSAEIFLAVNGEFNQQKGAALSLVLLVPTLTLFLVQNYWVSRRSYISVTGKPAGGQLTVKEPLIRWSFITVSALTLILVLGLYASIMVGSITRLWGIDYSLDLQYFNLALSRGLEAIIDTTFLSAIATPLAGLIGMLVAFLVIRKNFSGKEALDFFSNLGGAVPGTILGIGYIIAFIQAPWWALLLVYAALAFYFGFISAKSWGRRLLVILIGTLAGYGLTLLPGEAGSTAWLSFAEWRYLLAALLLAAAGLAWWGTGAAKRWLATSPLLAMALFLVIYDVAGSWLRELVIWGRTLPGVYWPRLFSSLVDQIGVILQPTNALLGLTFVTIGLFILGVVGARVRLYVALLLLSVSAALSLVGEPLALVGTSYIIIFAYAVRSLPASVRAGVAALQQIDPSIEEASANLGADAQYTFRRITLPLILPAFIAGLIFSFARHMTSLSAIIFLSNPKWRILTVEILSAVEQGGMSLAAAYSVVLVAIVLVAIGLTYLILGRTLGSAGKRVDLNI